MLYGPGFGGHWAARRRLPPDLLMWPKRKWFAPYAREMNSRMGNASGDRERDVRVFGYGHCTHR